MTKTEREIARALMQIKAEPFCTECGGSCLVIYEDMKVDNETCNIWTACTMCGTEMLWAATPNHIEMIKRTIALTVQQEGKVVEQYEFVHGPGGECIGLCGGVCPAHWRGIDEEDRSVTSDTSADNIII